MAVEGAAGETEVAVETGVEAVAEAEGGTGAPSGAVTRRMGRRSATDAENSATSVVSVPMAPQTSASIAR